MAIIKEVLQPFRMQSFNNIANSLPKFFQGRWRNAVVGTFLLLVSIVTFRVAVNQIEHNRILADTLSWTRESQSIDHGSYHDPNSTVESSTRSSFHIPIFQRQTQPKFDLPIRRYLESLEATTAAVLSKGGVQQDPKTHEEVEEERLWHKSNPCRARTQLLSRFKSRRSTPYIETPPEWAAVLEAYARFHRACTKTSGNLSVLFMSGVNRTDEGAMGDTECKFVIAQFGNGLGNRLMTLASVFLYAIVTQRVILVDIHSHIIPDLLCEPFSGSSWTVPPEFPLIDRRIDLWQTHEEHHAELDKDPNGTVTVNAVRLDGDFFGPVPRFYCPTEQASYSNVRWVTIAGCIYFLPKLFVVPTFAALLSSIFKNPGASPPLTHILRTTLVPSDNVWAQVLRADDVYLEGATRQVGVHIRYLGGFEDFRDHHELIISHVEECLLSNELLPVNANGNGNRVAGWPRLNNHWPMRPRVKYTILLISSLYTSLFDAMAERYPQLIADKRSVNSVVGLVQLSHEGQQLSTLETDKRALVDMICLSLSDVLLTSRQSTFSQIAQAWGGLRPWIINNMPDPDSNKTEDRHHPPCTRGSAIGGCFQNGGIELSCPHDQNLNFTFPNGDPSSSARFIRACEDGTGGIEFVPSD